MSRIRVLDLAKELGIDTKTTIAKLQELGIQVKNHFNALSDTDAAKLRMFYRSGKASEKDSTQKASTTKLIIRRKADVPKAAEAPSEELVKENDKVTTQPPVAKLVEEQIQVKASISETHESPQNQVAVQEPEPKVEKTTEDLKEKITVADEKIAKVPEVKEELQAKEEVPSVPVVAATPHAVTTAKEEPALNAPIVTPPSAAPTLAASTVAPAPKKEVQSAVIIRKAEIKPQSPERPRSYTSSTGGEGTRRGNVYTPRSSHDAGSSAQRDSRPSYPPRDNSQFKNRPYSGAGKAQPGGGQPYSKPSVPFVSSDSSSQTNQKDMSLRFKDREKDREKRKVDEFESARNKANLKGARRTNDIDDIYGNTDELELGDEHAIVRTMIPNRKRGSALKKKEHKKPEVANPTKASKKVIGIDEFISVNDLAGELSQKASAVIKTLMKLGMMATINQQIDFDTAAFVAQEFGFEVQNTTVSIGDILSRKVSKTTDTEESARPPIITIMGHVDHGKTSLLDAIRSTNVTAKEAGGITQHIGAYQIEHKGRKLTFLDTPGHEAFTSMRARGAQVTDVVVLVVAADDGVMPQTIEAIAHAKAANVPIIVAVNKIDKPGINLERIHRELAGHEVLSEEWGGESLFVKVSAKTHEGLENLIETILLQADVLDLKSPKNTLAEGIVIEAKLDKARGPVATVIVTKGTLKQQDFIVVGKSMGRIRAMNNDLGKKIQSAEPATPVEIIGLSEVPAAGDQFNCVMNDAIAKEAVAYRIEKQRQKDLASQRASTMEEMLANLGKVEEKAKEITIIIKADAHGSAEAIKASLQKLDTPKIKTKIIHSGVGGITETDVILGKASQALIVGFNVRPDRVAAQVAEQSGVKIQCFNIIYELIQAVEAAMLGSLAPTKTDKVIGHAEVRNVFSVPKVGAVAGSLIADGKVTRQSHVRIVRDGIVIYTGRVGSLKRFKDDAKEVAQGFECGIGVENYNDIKVGDVLEAFVVEETAATLH